MINSNRIHNHKPLLPGDQIRLLILYPAPHLNSPICCSLLQTCLNNVVDTNTEQSPYKVLLGWGSENRQHEIICDGKRMLVPQNCQVALRYLRLPSTMRTLWIDSVCVDQTSDIERMHHIRLTRDIYYHAKDVLVWMGETKEPLNKVIRRAARVGRFLQRLDEHSKRHPASEVGGFRGLSKRAYKLCSTDNVPTRWFARLEILQQVDMVVECNPILVSGYATIPLKHFLEWCSTQPRKIGNPMSSRVSIAASQRINSATTASANGTVVSNASVLKENSPNVDSARARDSMSPTFDLAPDGQAKPRKLQKRFSSGARLSVPPALPIEAAG